MKQSRVAAWLASAIVVLGVPAAFGQAAKDLNKCQASVAKEAAKYIRAVAETVGKCLKKMSTEVIEDGVTPAAAATTVAEECVSSFRKIVNTDVPSKQLADRFNAKVGKMCDPAINPGLQHMESDTYTISATTLSAANLNSYCRSFGGDGTIGDFDEWRDCLRTAADCEARQALVAQWPRALEYFAALNTAITALPPSTEKMDALAALAALDTAIEGATNDNLPELVCPPTSGLLKTGQTQCDQGSGTLGPCPGSPAGQDASVNMGRALSYTDNGNGTITDNVTGLMWEKLSDDGSIHDKDNVYTWYTASTGKIASLNAGSGFAGYTDWRLPNRRELESLVDAGRVLPAIDPAFSTACAAGCTVLTCSCTQSSQYWSSTTYQLNPTLAWTVNFSVGNVFANGKGLNYFVRAVRGGS